MKKIAWESWNQVEEDMVTQLKKQEAALGKLLSQGDIEPLEPGQEDDGDFSVKTTVLTPFGEYDADSFFRPSKRWSCWVGYTNFRITPEDYRTLNEDIEGIESLIVFGPYTFCIGIAKLFETQDVKQEVITRLCE